MTMVDHAPPKPVSTVRMLLRALTRRCPRCGSRGIFQGWFKLARECPRCHYHFEGRADEGFFLGAFAINVAVTFSVLLVICFFWIGVVASADDGVSSKPVLVIGGLCALLLPVFFYPISKTVWAAFEIAMRRMGGAVGDEDEAFRAGGPPSPAPDRTA
jgi:uncharacterized protein (DUF983 family)